MKNIKPVVSAEALILFISIYIATACNLTFWNKLLERLDITSLPGFAYFFTSFFVILFLISFIFFIFSQKSLIKPVLIFFILLSSIISYFNFELGVVFDKEMIRNIIENIKDKNINEAKDLFSFSLFLFVFFTGIFPSILISLLSVVSNEKPLRTFIKRSLLATCILLIAASTFFLNYKFYTFFYRQNEDLLVYINPIYPLVAVKKHIKRQTKKGYVFKEIGTDAREIKKYNIKTVGVMVIGETARADRFSLNGYQRKTNPVLSKTKNIFNFSNVHSCGTSTAYSVPCMFSFLNRDDYSPELALQYSNVLDVLTKAKVHVAWEENNSSCKEVCKRIEEINFINHPDKYPEYYGNDQYYDEVMMNKFNEVIGKDNSDVLLVLHSMGSHGPSYYNRYPESTSPFKPYCKKSSPQECNKEDINNAYDNTIAYTDHFLGLVINYLEQHEKDYDSFMLYASDHGESLGENGIYLHGLPYFLAPEAQTHVPLIMWLSDGFIEDKNINVASLKQQTDIEYSHDNLAHTLLGLFGVQTRLYNQKLDMMHFPKLLNSSNLKLTNNG